MYWIGSKTNSLPKVDESNKNTLLSEIYVPRYEISLNKLVERFNSNTSFEAELRAMINARHTWRERMQPRGLNTKSARKTLS